MAIVKSETMPIRTAQDLVHVRQAVRAWSQTLGFGLVDQTKVVTAASELARNTLDYGGGGEVRLEQLEQGMRRGLRLVFEDRGPGIADVEQAMRDGFSTGRGMGLGLGGAKRLSHEFELHSKVGEGTRVMLTRWK
jgi:serine/threonine-protein kinase RsbT